MKRTVILFVAAIVCVGSFVNAAIDDDWLSLLLSKLKNFQEKYPQEKVHIQFDKPYYSVGEDVWLKAYVVNSQNNELSALSKVLYVDFLNSRDSICKTVVLPVDNGLASGGVRLSDSVFTTGNYQIKAYTRWMQNFNPDFFFSKDIYIGDARKATGLLADGGVIINGTVLNANLTIRTLTDEKPAANKIFNYQVVYKGTRLAEGKTVTDADGKVKLTSTLKGKFKPDSVVLQTELNLEPQNIVKRTFAIQNTNAKPDVQFFPEGGRLVNGLTSTVGFKIVASDGQGANLRGKIINQDGKTIAELTAVHAGLGKFTFTPVAGNVYKALITPASGTEYIYNLPQVEAQGYVMRVDTVAGGFKISVASNTTNPVGELALIAQQNGIVRFTQKLKATETISTITVPKQKFGTGIAQFTLLSADGSPLAERIAFVNQHDQLKLAVVPDKRQYGRHEKVSLNFSLQDDDGSPAEGNFSVAVTNAAKVMVNDDAEVSILSNLLLTSDLRGYIENPNYYFTNESSERAQHLDLLMLTQGWRRFNWRTVNTSALSDVTYTPQENVSISGKITTFKGAPVPFGKVSLYAGKLTNLLLVDTVADANGNFVIDNVDIPGDLNVVLMGADAKGKKDVKVIANVVPSPVYTPFMRPSAQSGDMLTYLKGTQEMFNELNYGLTANTIQLAEVKVRDTRPVDKYSIKGSAKLGTGIANIVIKKEKIENYQSLWFAFYGLPGIEVKGRQIYSVGRVISIMRSNRVPMMLLVDGIGADQEYLQYLSPKDVEGIEIFYPGPSSAIYGDAGYWGVIQVTTRKGGTESVARFGATNFTGLTVHGFTAEREFYSPVYDKPIPDKERDLRSNIYWEPNVTTGADGKASIVFYTSDEAGPYRIVVEGLNSDGKLVRHVQNIDVK